jgi:hypothetical protein
MISLALLVIITTVAYAGSTLKAPCLFIKTGFG